MLFILGLLCNLNICSISQLLHFMRCAANVGTVRLYMHCAAHTVTAHNNEWLLRIENVVYTGTPMANISLIRFLSYYTSCGAITWYRLRLAYMHCTTHSYSS
jgi:hypothetical protein